MMASGREALFMVMSDLISPAKSEKEGTKTTVDIATTRTKLSQQAEEMADRLNKRMLEFVAGDESPYLKEDLFTLLDKERRLPKITPERIVFTEVLD